MKIADMEDTFTRSSSYLLIGPQGVGKSIAGASFPEVRLLDVEGKTESVVNWYKQPKYKKYASNIDIYKVDDVIKLVYETLPEWAKTRPPFKSLLLDSITKSSQDVVNLMLNGRRGVKASKDSKYGGDRAKIIAGSDFIIPGWDEFDGEDTFFTAMLGWFITIQKRWNINIICTAHPHTTQGPQGQSKTVRIVAKGHKAPQTILNHFNEIYHFEKETTGGLGNPTSVKRYALTQGGDFSRTSWPFLPAAIDYTDAPFYEKLRTILDANLGEEKEVVVDESVEDKSNSPQSL
jgi:hypothetical protein